MTLAVHRAEDLLGKTKSLYDTPLFNDQAIGWRWWCAAGGA